MLPMREMLAVVFGVVFGAIALMFTSSSVASDQSSRDRPQNTVLRVAVASNFAATARTLIDAYSVMNEGSIRLLVGATGKHASQIRHGLNVDVLLAADEIRPKYLEDNGYAVKGTRSTYAIGRLVLWSKDPTRVDNRGEILRSSSINYLAIANPKTAPYGIAAMQVLTALGISPNLVKGESVGQAFQFARSGNADLGLIALAQVRQLNNGSYWLVPPELHEPIEQQLVLVKESVQARAFLNFLRSEKALNIIESFGYQRPNSLRAKL